MSNNEGVKVTLYDTHVRVPNGLGASKNISIADFLEEVKRVAAGGTEQAEPLRAFRLPNEAVSFAISKHELRILMYFPEQIHDLKFTASGRTRTFKCPVPPTIIHVRMSHNVSNNRWAVEDVKWFCTDYKMDEVPSVADWGRDQGGMSNHLWALPFPNQYGDGRMCVGANNYRTLYEPDLRGLNELYYHVLVASPFNTDLGTRTKNSMSPGELFSFLNKKESFPFEILPGHPGTVNREELEAATNETYALLAEEEEDDEEEDEDE